MKTLIEPIGEAQANLDKIATHDDFIKILKSELWGYPATSLSQCHECLSDLAETEKKLKGEAT